MSRNDQNGVRLLPNIIDRCRQRRSELKLADSTGARLNGGETLIRALVLRRVLRRHFLADDERMVGIMMPPTVAGAVSNLALALDRRVTVNLNFMLPKDTFDQCIAQAELRHIVTSRVVLERLGMERRPEHIILEEIPDLVGRWDKLIAAAEGLVMPAGLLTKKLGLENIEPDDLFTILFTSGSTGIPKGVMLSYENVVSNCTALANGIDIRSTDTLIGILPFFHAFGATVALWLPLLNDVAAAYHTSPLEAEQVGRLTQKYGGTILVSTPTFLRVYLARCTPEQFATLDLVATGAEPLPVTLIDTFEQRFGIRPFEGYGATETAPAITFNRPPGRTPGHSAGFLKEGTVGKPLERVSVEIRDRENGRVLPHGEEGLVWSTGPNVMLGYLHEPEQTAAVVVDGWYNTGDIGLLDDDGFLTITGRSSQFSKIGGETVPHLYIEHAIATLLDAPELGEPVVAVTAVPDARKGERLIVVHTPMQLTGATIGHELHAAGFPALFIPTPDSFMEVDRIPVLPSGKIDLGAVRALAEMRFGRKPVSVGT